MKKFKAFLRPALTIMLMLSIFIPVISNVSIHVEAAEEFEAYTKSGEYPASDHIKNPIYIRPKGAALMIIKHFLKVAFRHERCITQKKLVVELFLKN